MLPRKMRPCFSLISLLILAISLHASPAVAAGDHLPASPFRRNVAQQRRQLLPSFSDPGSSPASTPASTPASSAPESTTSTPPPPTSTPSTPASSNPPSVASTPTPPSSAAAAPSSPAAPGPSSPSPTLPPVVSTSTNAAGSVVIITETDPAPSAPSSSTTSAGGNNNNNNSNSGTSTSTIVGLGVAGGVAVLGIIGFFVWKFTRKRFSDLDDNEAIKWPELNAHDGGTSLSAPLPTNRTGGAGFDSGAEISRPGSRAGYASSIGATSTTELYPAHADPYAVPPLPQFNPGQPYRDDPNAFYDPYSGPVPTAFGNNGSVEAIPMTQMAGRRSPGPGAVYGAPPPAAYSEYGAAVPPGPAYGGARTASPAPGAGGYGDRARSPGPGLASPVAGPGYGDRARSPGPGNAVAGGYGGYGQ